MEAIAKHYTSAQLHVLDVGYCQAWHCYVTRSQNCLILVQITYALLPLDEVGESLQVIFRDSHSC